MTRCTRPARPWKRVSSPAAVWPCCTPPRRSTGSRPPTTTSASVSRSSDTPSRLRPARSASNAGVDGSIVVGKLIEQTDSGFGYNAQSDQYGDMFQFGVIDPTKVVRTRTAGRRFGRRSADHHRGDGGGKAGEEGSSAMPAGVVALARWTSIRSTNIELLLRLPLGRPGWAAPFFLRGRRYMVRWVKLLSFREEMPGSSPSMTELGANTLTFVMPGLDPGIFLTEADMRASP